MDPVCNYKVHGNQATNKEERCCVGCNHKVYTYNNDGNDPEILSKGSSIKPDYAKNWFDKDITYPIGGPLKINFDDESNLCSELNIFIRI